MGDHFMFDQEKMVDFFSISKEDFLASYDYLTEDDYEATVKEAIKASGYWNVRACEGMDGTELKDIVLGCMMTKWLTRNEMSSTER